MNFCTLSKKFSGVIPLIAGVLLAWLLTFNLSFAGLEAEFYGFDSYTRDRMAGLVCPPIMTPYESIPVQLTVSNTVTSPVSPLVRIDVSTREVAESQREQLELAPGQSHTYQKLLTAENIDLGGYIFVRAYRYASYPMRDAEATCGVAILNLPLLSGAQWFWGWLLLSMALQLWGLWRWSLHAETDGSLGVFHAAQALCIVTLAGLLLSISGNWMLGILALAISILVVLAALRIAFAH